MSGYAPDNLITSIPAREYSQDDGTRVVTLLQRNPASEANYVSYRCELPTIVDFVYVAFVQDSFSFTSSGAIVSIADHPSDDGGTELLDMSQVRLLGSPAGGRNTTPETARTDDDWSRNYVPAGKFIRVSAKDGNSDLMFVQLRLRTALA